MPTAVNRALLETLVVDWQGRLQGWAVNGLLTQAAQVALGLDGVPQGLAGLVGEWSAADFRSLPPVALLSDGDIHGAQGAYAISTGTIYLNNDWLGGADAADVIAVLTEELGHHLDGLFNAVDTPGDEGEYFSLLLSGGSLNSDTLERLRSQDDHATIEVAANLISVEDSDRQASTLSPITGNGAFVEGVILSAGSVSYHGDGSDRDPSYKYQWYFNGAALDEANKATFAVDAQGTGTYKVAVSYINGQGYRTTLTSGNRYVGKIDNGQGVLAAITGDGDFVEGVILSAGGVVDDVDGGASDPAYTYQWYLDGALLAAATGATYAVDAQGTGTYKVAVSYIDGQGYRTTLTSGDRYVGKIDNGQGVLAAITGDGDFVEGVILSAGGVVDDVDGGASDPAYTYQWYLDGALLAAATGATYAVDAQGTGTYKVAVSYIDGQGYRTTLTSGDRYVGKIDNGQGVLAAITGDGDLVEGVLLSAGGVADDPDGTSVVTSYQWSRNGSAITGANASTYLVPTNGAGTYTVAVSYNDGQGYLSELTSDGVVVLDRTPPTVTGISVEGARVILDFSEAVTGASVLPSAFAVATVNQANVVTKRSIGEVTFDAANNTRLVLTLTRAFNPADLNLWVSYTAPANDQTTGVVEDLAGNDLASFSNRYADTFITSSTRTLASQYQNLTLTGTSNINGTGNALANTIIGNVAVNVITGAGGTDTMDGGDGSDLYIIATSDDHPAAEIVDSGITGTDELRFASLVAGQTLMVFAGDTGLERISIGTGIATLPVMTATTALNINASQAANGLIITGNDGSNVLIGTDSADVLVGYGGIDNMNGGNGGDVYLIASAADHAVAEIADSGTSGIDELRFAGITANQTLTVFAGDTGLERVTIGRGTAAVAVTTTTTALNVVATAAANALTITGNDGANGLTGTAMDDTIVGNGGRDTISGGLGSDTLTGGQGADLFRFDSDLDGITNVDLITDFTPTASLSTSDRIQLENTGAGLFTAITQPGTLAAAQFVIGADFVTVNQRIRYDSSSGNLFYDADGSGIQSSILFATLSPGLALNNSHFVVT